MSAVTDRLRRGSDHSMAKLTEADVVKIRQTYAGGFWTQVELAAEYGVAQSLISGIVNGRRWPHVAGPVLVKSYAPE